MTSGSSKPLLKPSFQAHLPLDPHTQSYSHVQVPALVLGVKIAPASSILVRHQGSWQTTQHGNHIVLNGAGRIIGLQKLWAVCHIKTSSVQSTEDTETRAVA